MKKLIITKEEFNTFKKYEHHVLVKEVDPLSYFMENRLKWFKEFEPIKYFTQMEFMALMCGWYKVEDEIKENDWVYDKANGIYRKVKNGKNIKDIRYVTLETTENFKEDFSKIEEPWKVMLLEIGREKPEFKDGDKYDTIKGIAYTVSSFTCKAIEHAEAGKIKYFYPVEDRIELK